MFPDVRRPSRGKTDGATGKPIPSCTSTEHLSRRALILGAGASLAACGLPQQGPRTPAILGGAESGRYVLVPVDANAVQHFGTPRRTSLGGFDGSTARDPSAAVGIGDRLDIRILEAAGGGLFASGSGGAGGTEFNGIVVGRDGRISLPYIGTIEVVGKIPTEIETRIVAALGGKAIEPQALVRIAQSDSNRATVAGDVTTPGPYPLSLRGDRLSEAIAASGGSRFAAHETRVTLVRGGRNGSARLSDILLQPGNDIRLQRDDLIVLTHEPPRFTLTGSVAKPGTYPLETAEYSVLEAISAAGGPSDTRADASGVFLFRYESRDRLAAAGYGDLDRLERAEGGLPTVFRFDMGSPEMQFHARRFLLADKDALFVATAGTVQLDKVLRLFDRGLTSANRADNLLDL